MGFHKITFLGGMAIGYVLGAQAGRERYEQLKDLARKAAENPGLQQTAGALQAQATATAKTARDKAASGVRMGASKVGDRVGSSRHGRESEDTMSNGAAPSPRESGDNPFAQANESFGHTS